MTANSTAVQQPLLPDLVLDGHDGVGKTTVAAALAERVGGTVLKPFANELGDHIAWLWRHGNYQEANDLCLRSVERVLTTTKAPRPWIFDRHWVTMFTVLPRSFHDQWKPLPTTVVLTADTGVMMDRLVERGEDPLERELHEKYRLLYNELGREQGALIIDTSGTVIDEVVATILAELPALGAANTAANDAAS